MLRTKGINDLVSQQPQNITHFQSFEEDTGEFDFNESLKESQIKKKDDSKKSWFRKLF